MKTLANTFNMSPLPATQKKIVNEVVVNTTQVIEEKDADFQIARQNLKRLLLDGEEALDGILDLARQGEHPRAYEVAGQLVKTLVDANKDLINIHKQKKDLEDKPVTRDEPKTVNNTVFVGSTADLQKALADLRNKQDE